MFDNETKLNRLELIEKETIENQREIEALAIADSYKEIDEPVLDWEEEFIDNLGGS